MRLSNRAWRVALAVGTAATAAVAAFAIPATTFAGFTDSTSNNGNSAKSGTLLVSSSVTGAVVSIQNAKPGQTDATATVKITNGGTLAAGEQLVISNIGHTTCTTCGTTGYGTGDLSAKLNVKIHDDTKNSWVVGGASTWAVWNALAGSYPLPGSAATQWAAAEAHDFTITVNYPDGDNSFQGTGATFDMTWNAAQ